MAAGDLTTLANLKQWLSVTGLAIATISKAGAAVIALQSAPSTPLVSGETYRIGGATGMTQFAVPAPYVITVIDPQTFSVPVNSTGFSTYTGGATVGITDPLLSRLITACSTFVQNEIGRTIALATYDEIRDGTGGPVMMTRNYPIVSVASVTVNGLAITARPPLAPVMTGSGGPAYVFDDTRIILIDYIFPRGYQNTGLVYDAGFATTPADLDQAVIDIIGDWFKYMGRIGVLSEGIEGQTISFTNVPITSRAKGVINNYRRVV